MVGHRGAGKGLYPENTLASFKEAIKMGLPRTELDVWVSKDEEIVVFHDETLSRLFPGDNRRIENLTLAEIKALDLQGQKISTLQEVINVCKGKIDLQIELKGKGTPEKVNATIVENRIEGNVLITSFDIELLKEMRRINPRIKMGLLFGNIPELLWNTVTGVPLDYICPKADIVFEDMIKYAHTLGVRVYSYHTNDKNLELQLIKWGINDIGTDFPNLFLSNNY